MDLDGRTQFERGAEAWAAYNRAPLGRIRQEVTWRNLVSYLPRPEQVQHRPRVLDAGGGSGELALKLVQSGYRVWLLDYAPAMLDVAQRAAQELPGDVRARLHVSLMSADDAPQAFAPGFFDAITCHTLIEYLPDPLDTLESLAGLLRDGGLLSLTFVNRHAQVLRQVWSRGDPAGALARLEDGTFCATLFDVSGVAYTAVELSTWLNELGLAVAATRGVRCFADYVPCQRLDDPGFFDAMLALESAVASRSPYCLLARYVHVLAYKHVALC